MKPIFILLILLLSACSFTARYPQNWEAIDQSKTCDSIIGQYKNNGEYYFDGKPLQRGFSYIVLPNNKQNLSTIESFDVVKNDAGLYKLIIGNSTSEFNPIAIELQCQKGSLHIAKDSNFTGHEPGALVLGVESNSFSLFNSANNNLILKTENSAVGLLMLVIPVAGSTDNWYKFERL